MQDVIKHAFALHCSFIPATGCNVTNDKAVLLLRDDAEDSKDKVMFRWLKGTPGWADFGDPEATTGYGRCDRCG